MANSFVTTKNIARQTLMRLVENLVFPNLMYKDYSNDFAKMGDTIRVRKPVVLEAQDFTTGSSVTSQDVKEDTIDVTLDKIATVDVKFEAIQMALNVDDLNRLVIEPAAVALAEKINSAGANLYLDMISNHAGTAGTTPDGLDDFAAIRLFLNQQKVPLANRVAVWDPAADSKFTQIANIVKVNESGTQTALREGNIGKIYGLDNYMSQVIKTHETGITGKTSVALNGATTKGTSTTLSIDGTLLTGKLLKGDILTIGTGASAVIYTVSEDSSTAASNAITGIKVNETIQTHSDDTTIAITDSYVANMAFHRDALAFVTRPLIAPKGVESYTTSYNGLSLRVVRGYDMEYKREKMSIDILYAYKNVYPEMAMVYLG